MTRIDPAGEFITAMARPGTTHADFLSLKAALSAPARAELVRLGVLNPPVVAPVVSESTGGDPDTRDTKAP